MSPGLMCWRELDVMVLAGSDFSPPDVMGLLARIVRRTGVTGVEYRDERGPRCVTGQVRDERYHVTLTVEHAGRRWQIDLTLWLHDLHQNVTRWHEELRERITAEQRSAVLRIKDDWHRRPAYPHQVGGLEIYTAVIDNGIRTPDPGPVRDLACPARPAGNLAIPAACPIPPGSGGSTRHPEREQRHEHSPFGTLCINIQARRLHVGRPRVCWSSEIAKPPCDNRAPTRRSVSPAESWK